MAERCPRGMAWVGAVNLVGGGVGSLIGLVLAAVVARRLGTEGAGTYFLAVAVFVIVSNVAKLGADTGLMRHVSMARATGRLAEVPYLVRVAVVPVLAVALLIVGITVALAQSHPHVLLGGLSPTLLVIGSALAVLSSLTPIMLGVTRGLGDVLTYPLLQNIVLPMLRLGGVFAVVSSGGQVTATLAAWMAPVLVVVVLAATVTMGMVVRCAGPARSRPLTSAERLLVWRAFWVFSATRGVSTAVETLLEWVDVILVGILTSPREAGIYAVVARCARVGEVVEQAARITVGPRISGALATGATTEVREIYGLAIAATTWTAWPLFLLLGVFGSSVLSFFGPGFAEGASSLAILSLAMALATAAGTAQTILLMAGRSSWQLADKSFALILNVALNLMLIPLWGINGAAVAWAVTILIDTLIATHRVQGLMLLRPSGRRVRSAASLAVGVSGVVTLASRLMFGGSARVMLATLLVVVVAHLAASWQLRARLGLVGLPAPRSD